MDRITDALELLTAQHDRIDVLVAEVGAAADVGERQRLVDELAQLLTGHLAIEQEVLYPSIAAQLSAGVRAELLAEHAEIKRALADLVWSDADDERFAPTLHLLRELLAGHAAWQDDQLFVPASQTMSDVDLERLGAHMQHWFDVPHAAAA